MTLFVTQFLSFFCTYLWVLISVVFFYKHLLLLRKHIANTLRILLLIRNQIVICEGYSSSTELFCVYQIFFFGNLDILLASIPLALCKFFGVALIFVGYLWISHNIFPLAIFL